MLRDDLARQHGQARRLARRGQGGLDLLAWGQKYLPEHFRRPPSNMHRWLAEQLDAARTARGTKLNVLGPRGGAKSTIGTLALPLRAAVECWEPYIWIVSDTKHQACAHLENIKAELLDNRRLATDFPDAVGRGLVWRGNSIVLRNGVTIEAFGTGQRIRGRRRRQHRPTLIVCDDLQNDGHIRSALQREHSRELVPRHADEGRHGPDQRRQPGHGPAPRGAGHGTAPHARLDLAALQGDRPLAATTCRSGSSGRRSTPTSRKPRYKTAARKFYEQHRPAMDAGAIVLWPEEEDLYTLMCMRVESGRTAFEREKQNSPINPDLCEWPESYFDESIWFEAWPANLAVKTMALDPEQGQRRPARRLLGAGRCWAWTGRGCCTSRPTWPGGRRREMVADGGRVVPPLPARRVRRRGQPVSGPAGRRVRGRVPPAGHFGRPARADREPHVQAGPHPPARAVSLVAAAAVQGRQSRHAAAGRAASRVPHRPTTTTAPTRWKWPCVWPSKCSTAARPTTASAAGCRWAK